MRIIFADLQDLREGSPVSPKGSFVLGVLHKGSIVLSFMMTL